MKSKIQLEELGLVSWMGGGPLFLAIYGHFSGGDWIVWPASILATVVIGGWFLTRWLDLWWMLKRALGVPEYTDVREFKPPSKLGDYIFQSVMCLLTVSGFIWFGYDLFHGLKLPGTHTQKMLVGIGFGVFVIGHLLMWGFEEPSNDFVVRGWNKRRSKEPKAELIWAWYKPPLTWRQKLSYLGTFLCTAGAILWIGTIALDILDRFHL